MHRESPTKTDRRARVVARGLLEISRLEGVPCLQLGRLWLISGVPRRAHDPAALAQSLLCNKGISHETLGRELGAREVISVDSEQLTRWNRAVCQLEVLDDLPRLIAQGVAPLRRWRGVDLASSLQTARRRIEQLGQMLRILPGLGSDSPTDLVQALPLRVHALSNWVDDPLERLCRPRCPVDPLLHHLARTSTDPLLSLLAGVLLGRRHREKSPAHENLLPPPLRRAFRAAQCPGSPVFLARLLQVTPPNTSLPDLPETNDPNLERLTERIALLHGVPLALRAREQLQPRSLPIAEVRQLMRRFVNLVGKLQEIRKSTPQDEKYLKQLRELPSTGEARSRALVRIFFAWMQETADTDRLLSEQTLVDLLRFQHDASLDELASMLTAIWLKTVASGAKVRVPPGVEKQQLRLTLMLTHPDLSLPIPSTVKAKAAQHLLDLARANSARRLQALWPDLVEYLGDSQVSSWVISVLRELVGSSLPDTLLRRALRLNVIEEVDDHFRHRPHALSLYLDALERLREAKINGLDLAAEWFPALFRPGARWMPALVITLLGTARKQNNHLEWLRQLSAQLSGTPLLARQAQILTHALEQWDAPTLENPPREREQVAALLGVEQEMVDRYLHHRRLAGAREEFASPICAPLHLVEREEREANYLARRLEGLKVDSRYRQHLQARLTALRDPAAWQGRLAQSLRRARKQLHQGLEQMRRRSLEQMLDEVDRRYLAEVLRRPVLPGPLAPGLRQALALFHASKINQADLVAFLNDILDGHSLLDREENQRWLQKARAVGIDTTRWLRGIRSTLVLDGEAITFQTESDPLAILSMGNYFGTCLALDDGCNAASTLINALDVNKQVIYGKKRDGTVVARKLIGATLRRELAGYHTYASAHRDEIRWHLSRICRTFAEGCGLRLSDDATPETLHRSFWYDDGNEVWLCARPFDPLSPVPTHLPNDPQARSEWHLTSARTAGNTRRLRALAHSGCNPWNEAALVEYLRRAVTISRETWEDVRRNDGRLTEQVLTHLGILGWLEQCERLSRLAPWCSLFGQLPVRREVHEAALDRVVQGARTTWLGSSLHAFPSFLAPGFLGNVSLTRLMQLFQAIGVLSRSSLIHHEVRKRWREWNSRVVQIAWLREGEVVPLQRGLSEWRPDLSPLIVTLLQQEVAPSLAPSLRKHLHAVSEYERQEIALALGTQGCAQDGPELLRLLKRSRYSIKFAVAVIRTGQEEACQAARAVWRPLGPLEPLLRDPVRVGLVREIGSPRLRDRLRKLLAETALAGCASAEQRNRLLPLLRSFALLEGSAKPLEQVLASSLRDRQAATLVRNTLRSHPEINGLARAVHDLPRRRELLERTPQEALAWWQRVQEQFPGQLRDARFERAIRQRAAQGMALAIACWQQLPTAGEPSWGGRMMGLIDVTQLPTKVRLTVVRECLAQTAALPEGPGCYDEVLTWARGFAQAELGPLQEGVPASVDWSNRLAWLLALEGDDSAKAETAWNLLQLCATRTLTNALPLLDLAMTWLQPTTADRLAREILARIPPEAVTWQEVERALMDRTHSYQLQRLIQSVLVPRLPETIQEQLDQKIAKASPGSRLAALAPYRLAVAETMNNC